LISTVEAGFFVEAFLLGDVIAGELALRDPFQLQDHLVLGGGGPGEQRQRQSQTCD
jgi:hypothetical protein